MSRPWQQAHSDPHLVNRLMGELHLTRPTALVLANRGITLETAEDFLRPRLQCLHNPYEIPGLETAAARLWQAVTEGHPILIHGDYDTDGITATVLTSWVLRECGGQVDCFLPHRINDGYGLTVESIDKAVEGHHRLLVTVDCGINSGEAAEQASQRGVDVIITDHHQPSDTIPKALAVINPKLHPQLPALQVLAGVGVAFKLCHAFLKYGREHGLGGANVDLREGLDLVALGTVADIVPLLGENRCLVRHGLQILAEQRRPGIRALCDISGLNESLNASDIAFRLAPRLNAAGRVGDAEDALNLLRATSIVDAYRLAQRLEEYNHARQKFEEEAYRAAQEQILGIDVQNRHGVVVKGRNWHRGVIGIVASRITQTYERPCVVLSIDDNGDVHGSARSVESINLISVLDGCRDHLVRYGGHPMASGLSLAADKLEAFEAAFETTLAGLPILLADYAQPLHLEGDVSIAELTDKVYEELELLHPFGHSHPAPIFRFRHVVPERAVPAGRGHTRGDLRDDSGASIPFIAFGRSAESLPPPPWDVAATPRLNVYRGHSSPQLQVFEIRTST